MTPDVEVAVERAVIETKLEALRSQWKELKSVRDHIAESGDAAPCPTCTGTLGRRLDGLLELLDAQLETVTVDAKYYQLRLEQLGEQVPDETVVAAKPERPLSDHRRKAKGRLQAVR